MEAFAELYEIAEAFAENRPASYKDWYDTTYTTNGKTLTAVTQEGNTDLVVTINENRLIVTTGKTCNSHSSSSDTIRLLNALFADLCDKYNWEYPIEIQESQEDDTPYYFILGIAEFLILENTTYEFYLPTGDVRAQYENTQN